MLRRPARPCAPRSLVLLSLCAAFAGAFAGACAGGTPTPAPDATPVRVAPPDSSAPADSSGLPASFLREFGEADARARAITFWLQCTATVARLRASGTFGPAARAPRALACTRTADGVPVGGVYDVDSAFSSARRMQTVRLDGARPRFTEPLDTTRLLAAARLARDVSVLVSPSWSRRGRPFSVAPVVLADGSVEGWVIPRATKARSMVTGGDVGYGRGPSGAPQVVVDRTATWTQLNLPPTGPLRVYSSVRDVAAVADLVTARYHAELGRSVTVSTPLAISTLVAGLDPATGARLVWQHRRVAVR